MLKKLKKLKGSLDKRMLQKTNKQMIRYIIVSCIIFAIVLFVFLKLYENTIIVCLLLTIYFIFALVVLVYLWYHQFLASLRDTEREKEELFKNSICLNVIPLTLDVCREILCTLEIQDNVIYSNEIYGLINKMIKNNEISITAELIDNQICIFIHYKGKSYQPQRLKSDNFRWFKANFSVI